MIHNKGKLLLRLAALVAAVGISLVLVAHVALAQEGSGTITVKKQTIPPGGTGFEFTHDIPTGTSPFYLDHGKSKTFQATGGSWQVTETEPRNTPGGYKLTKVECRDIQNPTWEEFKVASRTVTIQLSGQEVECIFTNQQWPPPVGGYVIPVNKLEILAPWLALVAMASFAALTVALVKRRRV